MSTSHRSRRSFAALAVAAAVLAGCTDDPEPKAVVTDRMPPAEQAAACTPDSVPDPVTADAAAAADVDGTTVRLLTHDSFATSDGIFDEFTARTGVTVEVLQGGDAGAVVSEAVLTAGTPTADVLFGVDTTFLCRATKAGVFTPYRAEALDAVPASLRQAPADLATPIDVGDVCLNYSKAAYPQPEDAPVTLDDLIDERFADAFVTENPETSSPGFAFLLATIARYGDDWPDWWSDVRANGVEVVAGWDEAYNASFEAGSGDRSIVTSYASSPVADVIYSDPPRDEPAIGVVEDSCFRQVEFAGILRGTDHPEAAALLVDFLLSPAFQSDIPLNMFVEPANSTVALPPEFESHRTEIEAPLTLSPAEIEAGRDAWLDRWTEVVLR